MFTNFVAKIKNESGIDAKIVAYYQPNSLIAEQYRNIRTYIGALNGGELFRTLLITSANQTEGKSLTCVNLAISMVEEKEKNVILVNTDFRQPAIEKLLNIKNEKGLSDFLKGEVALDSVLFNSAIERLVVLPTGSIPSNPTELLASQKMKELIGELEKRFNYIILDSPAIIPFADARILGPYTDGVLFVVQAGKTRREVVSRAMDEMSSVRAKLLGVILTQVEYYIPEYIHRHL